MKKNAVRRNVFYGTVFGAIVGLFLQCLPLFGYETTIPWTLTLTWVVVGGLSGFFLRFGETETAKIKRLKTEEEKKSSDGFDLFMKAATSFQLPQRIPPKGRFAHFLWIKLSAFRALVTSIAVLVTLITLALPGDYQVMALVIGVIAIMHVASELSFYVSLILLTLASPRGYLTEKSKWMVFGTSMAVALAGYAALMWIYSAGPLDRFSAYLETLP